MITIISFYLINLICNTLTIPIINFGNDTNLDDGGRNAKQGQFPYQVSIIFEGEHDCGGSIIDKNWVLTAAHCIESDKGVNLYKISAGNVLYKFGIKYDVEKLIPHENYNNVSYENDIGLIKILGDGFDLSDPNKIAIIDIVTDEIPIDANITASGWGLNNHRTTPDQLQYTDKLINSKTDECAAVYNIEYVDKILCLSHECGISICDGDSGGPALYNNKLAGIASLGYEISCGTNIPDVFTKVSAFQEWIYNKIFEEN